jgi:RNA polymerase-interacting CarD/CdnL/TRCF family regulator
VADFTMPGKVGIRVVAKDEAVVRALRNMSEGGARRAISRALNTAIDKGYTVAKRGIALKRNIKISAAGDAITKQHTNRNATIMEAALIASGNPIPVIDVQGTKTQTKEGVIAKIGPGEPHLFKGAFIARMPTGHVGVFQREFKSGDPQARREVRHVHGKRETTELPIEEKTLPSVAATMVQQEIVDALDAVVLPAYEAELARQLQLEWAKENQVVGLDTVNSIADALGL